MRRWRLRSLLVVPIAVTLSVGVLALAVFVERSVRNDLTSALDEELSRVATQPGASPRGRPDTGRAGAPPDADALELVDLDATGVPVELVISATGDVEALTPVANPFDASTIEQLSGTSGLQTVAGEPRYRVAAVPAPEGGTRVAALSLEPVDDSIDSLRRNMAIGGGVLFALQALVVWLIAARMSRPVARMRDVAQDIADGRLDTPIGEPEGPAETRELAADLQRMLDQLRTVIADNERSAAEAQAARDDMQRFLADASHELRTPLTALRGYSDLYQQGILDDEGVERAMGRIGAESERLTRLVVDMLHLVREGRAHERVRVHDLASAVLADLRAAYPDRPLELIGAASESSIEVLGDPYRLHQAVLNLGSNACQHTPDGTPIELAIGGDDDHVEIEVIDHGAGVPVDQRAALFRPFSRGDEARSRNRHDGAGLGLAIVAQVAEQHGATVEVDDTPGGGATFRLRIPAPA